MTLDETISEGILSITQIEYTQLSKMIKTIKTFSVT